MYFYILYIKTNMSFYEFYAQGLIACFNASEEIILLLFFLCCNRPPVLSIIISAMTVHSLARAILCLLVVVALRSDGQYSVCAPDIT